ncbi:MAG TPA: indole-3-glycerol phosphate synthase TrpC [Candidatus Micrarchaeaceae archaeon]|nr:indole-3-glycerol phosphate synthase TrpC [Candidatus Micrarchaeaceae archaeon]
MSDALTEIYRDRRRRLGAEMAREPLADLLPRALSSTAGRRSLGGALSRARPPALIAEIKRASPSAGLIARAFDPAEIAASYQAAGADAISVLTEEDHFQGHLSYLGVVRQETTLPVLRKDFLTTSYEVVQSAAYGADSFLAIVAGLTDGQLQSLLAAAREWRLEVLVEVHSASELGRAVALGATLLGINNRNLRTLTTDPGITESLIGQVPSGIQVVSESGFETAAQIERIFRLGVSSFLVGEALMRAADRTGWVRAAKAVSVVGA